VPPSPGLFLPPPTVLTEPSPRLLITGWVSPKPLPLMVIVCNRAAEIGLTESIIGLALALTDIAFVNTKNIVKYSIVMINPVMNTLRRRILLFIVITITSCFYI
jgi:hypothetical protein